MNKLKTAVMLAIIGLIVSIGSIILVLYEEEPLIVQADYEIEKQVIIINEIQDETDEKINNFQDYINNTIEYEVVDIKENPEDIEEEIWLGELEMLAQLVRAEAGNQNLEGKRLVVDVVLNRVEDIDWPNTITEVIYQPGQFTVMDNGAFEAAGWTMDESDFEAVNMELYGAVRYDIELWGKPAYYFSRGFAEYGTRLTKVGDHCFNTK